MGNCQAAEAATVLIQHPGGRIERIYWSLSARQVMDSHPGHYVAVIISSQPSPNVTGATAPVKHLKLLRPDDTLHIGHLYRLVSFDVLREFASKNHVRLSQLINYSKKKGQSRSLRDGGESTANTGEASMPVTEPSAAAKRSGEAAAQPPRAVPWRPALKSIAEVVGS